MKKDLLFFLLFGILSSCSLKDKTLNHDHEERTIIEIVLNEKASNDSIYRRLLTPAFQLESEIFLDENSLNKSKRDSIQFKRDSAKTHLFLSDSLIPFPPMKKDQIIGMAEGISFETILSDLDSGFREVLLNLIKPSSKKLITIDVLKSTPTFQVIYKSELQKYKNVMAIGVLTISQIAFNSNNNKACVYTEFVCGGECGGSELLFLEKKMDKWLVIKTRRMGVS
ncbi:MAG: hypothetical protein DI538_07755 [Azospira oryzae]|nr:MAG: hypothetical protein DI538_07755 [Azospira oryzae]